MNWIRKDNIATRSFNYKVKPTFGGSYIDEENMIIYYEINTSKKNIYVFLDIVSRNTGKHLFIQLHGTKWGISKTCFRNNFTHEQLRDIQYHNLFGEDSPFPEEYTIIRNKKNYIYQIVIPEEKWFEDNYPKRFSTGYFWPRYATGISWMHLDEAIEKLDLNCKTKSIYSKLINLQTYI